MLSHRRTLPHFVYGAADYALNVSSSSTVSTLVGTTDTNDFIPGWHNYNISGEKPDPSPELFAPFGGDVAACSATHGLSLSDGDSNHGGSVGAPLASLGDGNIQPRSLGATRPGSREAHSSWNASTSQRGGVSGAKVSGDGGGTFGAARGLHEGAGGHGGSVGAPLASFGDVGNKPRSLGAACAGSLVHRSGVLGATVSASGCDGSAPGAVRGPDGNDDSRKFRLRHARSVLCDRQSSDDGKNPSRVVGPHKAPPLSGDDASLPSDDTSVAITGGRDGSSLGAARGRDDSDDSLESRLRHASGTPYAR